MLLIFSQLYHAVRVDKRGSRVAVLKPGFYIYVGSACGPGGLRARISRHLCGKRKRLHWHIDRILSSPYVQPLATLYYENLCVERVIASRLGADECFEGLAGIGASDDMVNSSHFYRVVCVEGVEGGQQFVGWLSGYMSAVLGGRPSIVW